MELFSAEFFSALFAIIIIDLVLAGDNAIVIALAARNLPPKLRQRAIIWGTFGAIAMRTAMTMIVVWLLKIPGLMLIGGALLVWIALKLIVDNEKGDGHHADPASGFWGAMKTIIVADALMGLDNVLAVAGAAHGSFLLVVLGLLISIPIVIWGSQLILKFVERYPAIVYIGAGVLAWTSVKMMTGEPLVKPYLADNALLVWGSYVAVIGGVLGAGFMMNHAKVRRRVAAHLVRAVAETAGASGGAERSATMPKVLVPVDGSGNSLAALRHVVNECLTRGMQEVHVLHVRSPFVQNAARLFVGRRNRAAYHRRQAEMILQPARALLESHRIPFATHVESGDVADTINRVAQRLHADRIAMGTTSRNSITRIFHDSVAHRVLELARVPVEVVAGGSVSNFERFGLPAGVAAALALVFVATG